MYKSKKLFITPEVPNSFTMSLKELSLFSDSDIIATADWIGHNLGHNELLSHIQVLSPNLILTSDRALVDKIGKSSKCKIFLLTEGYENLIQLWVFQLRIFLGSQNQIFTI